jgi:hypothetical protein
MAKGSFTSAARDVIDIRKFRPKIDPRVARAIERCLVHDPAGRFQSLDEFARDLAPVPSIDG